MCNSSSSSVCEEGLQSSSSAMNLKLGGWAFLQSLSNKTETQKPYHYDVHPTPTQKRFCLRLEMCTENLGCENGTSDDVSVSVSALFSLQSKSNNMNTLSSSIIMSSPPPQSHNDERKYCSSSNSTSVSKRWKRSGSGSGTRRFPPPLSSRSEEGGVQLLIRRRREHGRLILEAVPNPSFFKAERSNGRLTLRLFTHYYSSSSSTLFEQLEKQGEEGEDQLQSQIESEEEEDDDETEELDDDENMNEDEMGIRKLPRPSRCYQNGNRNCRNQQLLDLEPFWVAT